MTKHHAYLVKWRDSASSRSWQAIHDDHSVSAITSIGWMIKQTQTAITLTTCISENGNVRDAITIPREAVVKMSKLKNYVLGT